MPDRVALVAFKFPPYEQVGARRWTKLTKYLAREGLELDVFCANWGSDDATSLDVEHPNIHIHRVRCVGLHRLWVARFDRATIRGRIGWFIERVLTRRIRGWPVFEEARHWRRLPTAVVRVMDERTVDTLVVTGGPFWSVHHAARVKEMRPHVRFIVDYRDPWTLGETNNLDKRQRRAREREVGALSQADTAVAVTRGLAEIVRAISPDLDVRVIRNGCDPDEFPRRDASGTAREPVVIHAGNLYAGRERPLAALLDVLSAGREGFADLRFEFFGGFPAHLAREHKELVDEGVLKVSDRIAPDELMQRIAEAYACLHFNAAEFPFALSTKIYEYAYAGRPTMSVNYGGEIEDLICEHGLGWSAPGDDPRAIRETLVAVQESWQRDPAMELDPSVAEQYTYPCLAAEWLRLLDEDSTD